jgi:acetyltransferase-like isoleucine patch superfamily enzyme
MDKHRDFRFDTIIEDKKRSFLRKYQDLVIGNRKLSTLLFFELCLVFINPIQGALGLALRKLILPKLFSRVGSKVIFGHHLHLRSPGNIQIGNNTVIDDFATLSFRGSTDQYMSLGSNVLIGRQSMIKTRGGNIKIHDHVHIGPNCLLGSAEHLEIGEYTLIGFNCSIGGLQHGFENSDKLIVKQALVSRGGVTIGRDVWLGGHVSVMDGVTIGDSSVIGAGSVVVNDIPPYSVAVGVPARVIRTRSKDEPTTANQE